MGVTLSHPVRQRLQGAYQQDGECQLLSQIALKTGRLHIIFSHQYDYGVWGGHEEHVLEHSGHGFFGSREYQAPQTLQH